VPAGISVRRVEDITEALWGTRVSPSTLSDLNKIYETIETWRNRPIGGEHPSVYLDGIIMKRSWAGEATERATGLLENLRRRHDGQGGLVGVLEAPEGSAACRDYG
jgi:putative transposase